MEIEGYKWNEPIIYIKNVEIKFEWDSIDWRHQIKDIGIFYFYFIVYIFIRYLLLWKPVQYNIYNMSNIFLLKFKNKFIYWDTI